MWWSGLYALYVLFSVAVGAVDALGVAALRDVTWISIGVSDGAVVVTVAKGGI